MARGHSSIDPSSYASLALTHVQYDPSDSIAKVLALVTLSPIFLLCSYVTIILLRRELTFINAMIGQLACEGLNWALKRLFRQARPTTHLGSGYGMPSSHSQFLGFFAAFFLAHFYLNSPPLVQPRTLVNSMRRFEHGLAMALIALLSVLTCYSRYHLHYHSVLQIAVGLSIGLAFGSVYYYFTEFLSRKPLPLPAPFAVSDSSSSFAIRANRILSPESKTQLRQRKTHNAKGSNSNGQHHRRRSSTLSEVLLPELHPSPPLRQILLDHPLAVAFRIRDSWAVWKDGGIEGEYGAWRKEWVSRRTKTFQASGHKSSDTGKLIRHYEQMLKALEEAGKCEATDTAFCVGCVISIQSDDDTHDTTLITGFSRELPGNTHAEQCALDKLLSQYKPEARGSASSSIVPLDLYTTMEPCSERLSGNLPCVQRILEFNNTRHTVSLPCRLLSEASLMRSSAATVRVPLRIARVFQGVSEPDDFVQCQGQNILRDNGIEVITVTCPESRKSEPFVLEKECLRVARKGHA